MRRATRLVVLSGIGAALAGVSVPAITATTFIANLTTSAEPTLNGPTTVTGAPRPTPFGTGTFILNDAQTALTYSISVFNIDLTGGPTPLSAQSADVNDNLVAAHIHAGASIIPTAGVVFGFFGSPFNDIFPPDTVVTPFASGVGGTITGKWDSLEGNSTTLGAQLANLLEGRSYVNLHTVQNPGGEIRGTLVPVPEPATWAMMLLGFGMVGATLRYGRRRMTIRIAAT